MWSRPLERSSLLLHRRDTPIGIALIVTHERYFAGDCAALDGLSCETNGTPFQRQVWQACHRVVGANGSLTGYAGGLHRKQWLLVHERTQLDPGRRCCS